MRQGRFRGAAARVAAIRPWRMLGRYAAAPGVMLILFGTAMVLSLGSMLYTQRATRLIVERDMRLVAALGDAAAAFDHADGDLYRLMVDRAVRGEAANVPARANAIHRSLGNLLGSVRAIEPLLRSADRRRVQGVLDQIATYDQTVDVVASMLDVNFASAASMMAPFRANADQVIRDVGLIRAAGIADARDHAIASAEQGRRMTGIVAAVMTLLMVIAVIWMVLASHRGVRLRGEMARRRSAEASALELANADPLTGLANRRVFVAAIDAAIAAAAEFSVVLIDLDHFKQVNDRHGHAAGDAVLRAVSARLAAMIGAGDMVARLGGDEFAAVVRGPTSPARSAELEAAFADAVRTTVDWLGQELRSGGSVGVATFPSDADSTDPLLHAADLAMYRNKAARKRALGRRAPDDADLQADDVRRGLAEGEFVPFYQPIVDLCGERVLGYEILARWLHPLRGLVGPQEFIPLAERSGQLTLLTEALLHRACADRQRMPADAILAINLAPAQLREPGLADRLLAAIEAAHCRPGDFEFEITESAALPDGGVAVANVRRLADAGATFALDDFGVGFSNMATLGRLRFDRLKIDRSFIRRLPGDRASVRIVETLLTLAAAFDLTVTAEGVEDREVADFLRALGVNHAQGFFFGHPRAVAEPPPEASRLSAPQGRAEAGGEQPVSGREALSAAA